MARKKRPHKTSPKTPARVRKRRGKKTKAHAHHHPELVGLGLCGLGVFLAAILWFGFNGGPVARLADDAIGAAAYLMPLVLVPLGALIVMRSALIDVRPFRLGLGVALLGLMLTLGTGHGGLAGDGLERLVALGLGTTGSTILGVLLTLAGVLFLTGASLGAILRRTGHVVHSAQARVRRPRPRPEPVAERDDLHESRLEPPVDVKHDYPDLVTDSVSMQPAPLFQREPDPFDDAPTNESQEQLFELPAPAAEYTLPDRDLLKQSKPGVGPNGAATSRIADALITCLAHFGVEATVVGQISGPRVTRYELQLAPGTKVGKVANLKDDLSYALATTEIRILAPIPGKQAVGVEVPNLHRRIVRLGDVFQQPPKDWSPLTVWLGKDVAGKAIGADLAKMPHLLVAGTTGAGKSGAINAMLSSVLLRATPHEVRLVLVDPKQVELNHYESIPHLLTPVITSPRMAANALQNLVKEMEQRYGIMSMARTRGLIELNSARAKRGEAPLPYILCVIDELADLMMVAPADVEDSIIRLAQKARAVGIHLVLATQSPRVDVITGMIKANVPSRIAFAVSSQTDSRVILDQNGAEALLGAGDMLFSDRGGAPQRLHGCYVDEEEIHRVVEFLKTQARPVYNLDIVKPRDEDGDSPMDLPGKSDDDMYDKAVYIVTTTRNASISWVQRQLRIGYNRAARLVEQMEKQGVVSPPDHTNKREVLVAAA